MKFLISLLVLVTTLSVSLAKIDLSQEFIDSINQKQSSWVAGRNFPESTPQEHLQKIGSGFLGIHPDPNYRPVQKTHNIKADIPETFDAREKWSYCESLNRIRDQGGCGSCWAFAATETMSDRLCIHSSGSQQFTFSPEDLLSCCTSCGTCAGGWMMPAYDYYISDGLVSGGDLGSNEGCRPYTSEAHDNGQTPACSRSCVSSYSLGYDADKHYGSSDYEVDNAIEQIQYEVMTNGPVQVNFEVFADFYSYQSGVYQYVDGNSVGYHVVKIIGWGTENGIPYWLIANSWGSWWGAYEGFFKMRRGYNECGIENYPYAILPRL